MANIRAGHRAAVAYVQGGFKGDTDFNYGSELKSEDCHDDTNGMKCLEENSNPPYAT
jgi:hypothetical protein